VAGRQPDPCAARDWDHRQRLPFASAFISADTVRASTGPAIRLEFTPFGRFERCRACDMPGCRKQDLKPTGLSAS
jgi:hypothetical protein